MVAEDRKGNNRRAGVNVEIDSGSGFCFGVTRAIRMAEEELGKGQRLFCLGDIVHNDRECLRLRQLGLTAIDHTEFCQLQGAKVLLRAHGEPPSTYRQAKANGIDIMDATCPVVLQLQERIKREYDSDADHRRQIVIFGKNGHAEVLGLVGQTDGTAIVVETIEEVDRLDFGRDITLYSQTTMSPAAFGGIVERIRSKMLPAATFRYHDTICRQVANRMGNIHSFALRHDAVLFVCGKKSSNGIALFRQCLRANPRSHMVEDASEICPQWLSGCRTVGICGATSTPKWLMEECLRVVQGGCEGCR